MAETGSSDRSSRRDFLANSTAAAVAGASFLAAGPEILHGAFAAGSDMLKLGLVGCGGRGTGAAGNAMDADPNVKIVALGDTFADKIESSLKDLKKTKHKDRVDVPTERQFVGFDAYKQVIDSGVDVVLLCSPPHFRPEHLRYAIDQGKHVFCEKPVAVDGPGVRAVFDICRDAQQKNLAIVSGLCWRYDLARREIFEKIHSGAIGQMHTIQATYHTSTLKKWPRQPSWSDMEFQVRNWNGFTWLSGDFNVEQHVHSLDKVMWAMGDEPPVQCVGTGGRQARVGAESGNVYDHFSVVYEFKNGVKAFASCRQMDGCDKDVSDNFFGTKGVAHIDDAVQKITGENPWHHRLEPNPKKRGMGMYVREHHELYNSIRAGKPINNGDYMTKSTLMGIMGRMSAYTGKVVTWEQALNSKERLGPLPSQYKWGSIDVPPIATPGVTQFV